MILREQSRQDRRVIATFNDIELLRFIGYNLLINNNYYSAKEGIPILIPL